MANVFNARPDLMVHQTRVTGVRDTPDGTLAVALAENIVRPAGGGQPQDRARLRTRFGDAPAGRVFKADGETWIEVDGVIEGRLEPGDPIGVRVDEARRQNLSRCHTLTHLGMAAVRRDVTGYESKGADIADNATDVVLRFRCAEAPGAIELRRIEKRMRSMIHRAIPVRIGKSRSLEAAAATYPEWRVDPDSALSGRVRIVHIEGVDANPCSGSHVADTSQVGPFELLDCRMDGRGTVNLALRRTECWMTW